MLTSVRRPQPRRKRHIYSNRLFTALWLLIVVCSAYSPFASSDNPLPDTPFYKQYQHRKMPTRANTNSLLTLVMPYQLYSSTPISNPAHEDDLAFNYLWLQQHQPNYSYHNGGGAANRLLRLSLNILYKNRYGGDINLSAEDGFGTPADKFDYRLRMSDDKVKLGVEYGF